MSGGAMKFTYSDGGRAAAGFTGGAGDCVTRAISIATGAEYRDVYDGLFAEGKAFAETHRCRIARAMQARGASPRRGVYRRVYEAYLNRLGWAWTPTMSIGQGCTVHLRADELPSGRIIARCSKHLVAIVDGVAFDTKDPRRGGRRCVYGYYEPEVGTLGN